MLHALTLRTASLLLTILLCCANAQAQNFHPFNGVWQSQDDFIYLKYLRGISFDAKIRKGGKDVQGLVEVNNGEFFFYRGSELLFKTNIKQISSTVLEIGGAKFDWLRPWSPSEDDAPQIKPKTWHSATITHVVIERISDTKSSGASWDNYMGNYKPDVYAIIKSPGGNESWRSAHRHDDLTNNACPVQWSLSNAGGITIQRDFFKEKYDFELWDMDNTTLHDYMTGFYFSLAGHEGENLIFDRDGFRIVLKVHWDSE